MTPEPWIKLIEILIWPFLTLMAVFQFYRPLVKLLGIIISRVEAGAEFTTPWASIGSAPTTIEIPKEDEPITENHMALIHSSWRYSKKDKGFKRRMYAFHAIIQAPEEVLNRIEYVKYSLHPSYPNHEQTVTDRKSHFKLNELAWGESNLKAAVKIKGQEKQINLTRYINLTETGPRIP